MADSTLYTHKGTWKRALLLFAASIVAATVWYTGNLAREIKLEEERKVQQLAKAFENISSASLDQDFTFMIEFVGQNETIPVILVDESGQIVEFKNLHPEKSKDPQYLESQLKKMIDDHEPVVIEVYEGTQQYLYYSHSRIYSRIRFFPLFQLSIIGAFLLAAYAVFSTSRRAEQNRVWVGMAKETAHQLGTPITSLVSWVEYLKETLLGSGASATLDPEQVQLTLDEMSKDTARLELIAERFSKVGSTPDLQEHDLNQLLENSLNYIKRRASKKVQFFFNSSVEGETVLISPPLFEWVIENLLKNALDAMEGQGKIEIQVERKGQEYLIDVSDSGKGIPKSKFLRIFEPGFSTKKRGWGLGLTLTKRIVENYHAGKIFVKESTPGKGTTFRIQLPAK
jgi:signal transduction histidine kinase